MAECNQNQPLIPNRIKASSSYVNLLCFHAAATLLKHDWITLLQLTSRFLSPLLKTNANVIFQFELRSPQLTFCHKIAARRLIVEFPSERTAFSTVLFHQKNSSLHFVNIQNGVYFWEFSDLKHKGSFFFKAPNLKSLRALSVTNWNVSSYLVLFASAKKSSCCFKYCTKSAGWDQCKILSPLGTAKFWMEDKSSVCSGNCDPAPMPKLHPFLQHPFLWKTVMYSHGICKQCWRMDNK